MRFHIYTALAAFLSIGCSVATAADVRTKQYSYGYGDTVKGMGEDAFLVCGDCQLDKLNKLPVRQIVAIKMNPMPVPPQQIQVPPHSIVAPHENQHGEKGQTVSSFCNANHGCLDEIVLFKFDSDKLRAGEKSRLDEIISKVPGGASLTVTGYTCTVGTKEYNLKLSKRRADAVTAYLESKGVKVSLTEGKGECCAVAKDKKLNRRVEVIEKEKK